eukprot:m.251035 g.251035  ORF g.251035 m.251035 type:complete len:247 (+) comp15893_c0_seq6:48-788(+)
MSSRGPKRLARTNEALRAAERKRKQKSQATQPKQKVSKKEPNLRGMLKDPCSCKSSKCLKLYCACFSSGHLCGPNCKCQGCLNDDVESELRKTAVVKTLSRDSGAFTPKFLSAMVHDQLRGCKCVNSKCLKGYCECFQAGSFCTERCRCVGCENTGSSEQKRAVLLYSKKPRGGSGKGKAATSPRRSLEVGTASAAAEPARTISDQEIKESCRRVAAAGVGADDPELAMAEAALSVVSYVASTFTK